MTMIRNAVKLTNAGAAIDKLKQERDTYRDLCAELLAALNYSMEDLENQTFSGWHVKAAKAITKAESILGEKNGR